MEQKSLLEVQIGTQAVITDITGCLHLKRRLLDLGFVVGSHVKIINISPLKNSFLLQINDYVLALRKNAVKNIMVSV